MTDYSLEISTEYSVTFLSSINSYVIFVLAFTTFVTFYRILVYCDQHLGAIATRFCDNFYVKLQKYYYLQFVRYPYILTSFIKRNVLTTRQERILEEQAVKEAQRLDREVNKKLRGFDARSFLLKRNRRMRRLQAQAMNSISIATVIIGQFVPTRLIESLKSIENLKALIPSRQPATPTITFKRRRSIISGAGEVVQPYPNADNLFDHLPKVIVVPLKFVFRM